MFTMPTTGTYGVRVPEQCPRRSNEAIFFYRKTRIQLNLNLNPDERLYSE